MMSQKKKMAFGDFQTPFHLALQVSELVHSAVQTPAVIVEPTCGRGNFIKACLSCYGNTPTYYGFDINESYISTLRTEMDADRNCTIEAADFFSKDWNQFFSEMPKDEILVIGNPPWVTNAALGVLNSNNLPDKSNFQQLSGFSAKTGKANFDIAEWMLIKLIESLQPFCGCIAMLCKTTTARKVLKYLWNHEANIHHSSIHRIDAKKHFDVSVDACLFITHTGDHKKSKEATIYTDLSFRNKVCRFGLYRKELIANIEDYEKYHEIEGMAYYKWRSGIKHDASKVMELTKNGEGYVNGFGETIRLEDQYIYPLLKSSDIGNGRVAPRKYVLITQRTMSEDTSIIQKNAPKTWAYLEKYADILKRRKSIVYNNRPRYALFGIGAYSFSPWKVAVSGLYKNIKFTVVGSVDKKPFMVDDTCYFISCESEHEARFICNLLNSDLCQRFLKSLVFLDAKRPINMDILKRIDLKKVAGFMGLEKEAAHYIKHAYAATTGQFQFVFEKEAAYQTSRCT